MTDNDARMLGILREMRDEVATRVTATAADLATLTHDRTSSHDDDEHDPDGVTLSAEWSRLRALADAAEDELRQVDEALERLESGQYGLCASCGNPIPVARLEIRPFATLCVPCAEKKSA